MFQDSKTNSCEWKSLPKKAKSAATDHSTQTHVFSKTDAGHQSIELVSHAVQTEKEIIPPISSSSKEANSAEMLAFLGRVEALMSNLLIDNINKAPVFTGNLICHLHLYLHCTYLTILDTRIRGGVGRGNQRYHIVAFPVKRPAVTRRTAHYWNLLEFNRIRHCSIVCFLDR